MKKKGFTLVELLAVIVILAVIALIATPTILGVIDKAKRSSLQDSGYGLVEAANLYYAQYSNGKTVRFDIEDNQIITETENTLNYKGTIKNGTVLINNKGEITVCINDGKYAAYKNYQDTKVTIVDSKTCTIPENKYVVYLDNESTITELTNQQLTAKIEELEEKINNLESNKTDAVDFSNLSAKHTEDINTLNIELSSVNSRLNTFISNTENVLNTINTNINNLHNKDYTIIASGQPGALTTSFSASYKGLIVIIVRPNGNKYNEISITIPINAIDTYRNIGASRQWYENTDTLTVMMGMEKDGDHYNVTLEHCRVGNTNIIDNSYFWIYAINL